MATHRREQVGKGRAGDGKRRAKNFGFRAESAAVFFLRCQFYTILARRYAIREGEVDVIARRGAIIAFVEVKARATLEAATLAITPQKQRRFSRAAQHWLARHPQAKDKILRADAIFIAPWRLPKHCKNFFELNF